jgi:hypothetical protein
MPSRKFSSYFLGVALAASLFTTGCQPQPQTDSGQSTSQPAPNETVIYNKWEVETHRPHKEIAQRPPEEQKEYNDWRHAHPDLR